MTTLTKGADEVTLPEGLIWTDEFDFKPVVATTSYGIDGALFIDEGARLAGRPMTLEGGISGSLAWGAAPRSVVETLEAWKALPGQTFVLNYRDVDHTVVMDHSRGALSAVPIRPEEDYDPVAYYVVTLRFLKV